MSHVEVASLTAVRAAASSSITSYDYEALAVSRPKEFVLHVELNRPGKLNAMTRKMWSEILDCFNKAAKDPDVRAIIISGRGKFFSAGVDLNFLIGNSNPKSDMDVSRRAISSMDDIRDSQECFSSIEKCNKPVLVAVHSGCLGVAVDLITACDIRLQTKDAWYSVKEVDVGIAADLGTLQRLPRVIGNDSLTRELCLTARPLKAQEAKECGLVSQSFETKDEMMQKALELAETISRKSPVAIQGTKLHLNYSRGRTVQEGLDHMVFWNACMLQSEDLERAAEGILMKKKVVYSKL